jgi:hypothetical protein
VQDDCSDDYYLRSGYCGGYPVYGGRYYHGRPGNPDLYRSYYRWNNSLYYKDRHKFKDPGKPGQPPVKRPPVKPEQKPMPRPEASKSAVKTGNAPQAAEELPPKAAGQPARR